MTSGTLYIVSTPIGNLEDITLRAVRILKEVDLIAAEDTRHARILLDRYEIKTHVESYHSYSDNRKIEHLIALLIEGKSIALISDAGTPGISDPAYTLIQSALANGIKIEPIPGASALLAALVGSGLPMHHFRYYGFLPLKKGRKTLIASWKTAADTGDLDETIIIYESPHRLTRTLHEFAETLGADWHACVARELTKIHEEYIRGTIKEVAAHYQKHPPKGECVIMLHNA